MWPELRSSVARIAVKYIGIRIPDHCRVWFFTSETSQSGRIAALQHLNGRIGEAGGARFWFHALRKCFISVADRELMLPPA